MFDLKEQNWRHQACSSSGRCTKVARDCNLPSSGLQGVSWYAWLNSAAPAPAGHPQVAHSSQGGKGRGAVGYMAAGAAAAHRGGNRPLSPPGANRNRKLSPCGEHRARCDAPVRRRRRRRCRSDAPEILNSGRWRWVRHPPSGAALALWGPLPEGYLAAPPAQMQGTSF